MRYLFCVLVILQCFRCSCSYSVLRPSCGCACVRNIDDVKLRQLLILLYINQCFSEVAVPNIVDDSDAAERRWQKKTHHVKGVSSRPPSERVFIPPVRSIYSIISSRPIGPVRARSRSTGTIAATSTLLRVLPHLVGFISPIYILF